MSVVWDVPELSEASYVRSGGPSLAAKQKYSRGRDRCRSSAGGSKRVVGSTSEHALNGGVSGGPIWGQPNYGTTKGQVVETKTQYMVRWKGMKKSKRVSVPARLLRITTGLYFAAR